MRRAVLLLQFFWISLCAWPEAAGADQKRGSGTSSSAQGANTEGVDVVLRVDPELAAVSTRVAAELKSLGLTLVLSDPSQESLEDATRRGRALAGVAVSDDGSGIHLIVFDRVTGKWTRRTLARTTRESEEVIALSAAELLRVSLLELVRPGRPPGEVEAPERVLSLVEETAEANRKPAVYALGIRGGVEATRGFSSAPGADVVFRARQGDVLEFGVLAMQQLAPQQTTAETGRFELLSRRLLLLLGGRWVDEARWQLATQLGVGVTHLRGTGIPRSDWLAEGSSEGALLPTAELSVEGRRRLFQGAWLTLAPTLGVTNRRTALEAFSEEVAVRGRSWWRLALGLEVQW